MSVGVTIAATVIFFFPTDKYPWAKYVDPACTLLFSILVCYTCKQTLGSCIYILMEGAPVAIEGQALHQDLQNIGEGVTVHDFHVWSLSRGKYAMSAKIRVHGQPMAMLKKATQVCSDYGLDHCTLQVEDANDPDLQGTDILKQKELFW